jgi:hypothetical protein
VDGITTSKSVHSPIPTTAYSVPSSFNSYSKPSLGVFSIGSGVTGVTGVTLLELFSEVSVSDVIEPSSTEPVDDIDEVSVSEFIVGEESSALVSPQAEPIPIVKVAKNATIATNNFFSFILVSP